MRVWIGRREQARRLGAGRSATASTSASSAAYARRTSAGAAEDVAEVDCDLVRPRQGRVPVRGRVDGDARRAAPPPPRPDPAGRRHSSGSSSSPRSGPSSSATSSSARRCCATALERGNWHVLKCEPPAGVPRPRRARPRRPGAVPRARSGRRAERRAAAACSAADRGAAASAPARTAARRPVGRPRRARRPRAQQETPTVTLPDPDLTPVNDLADRFWEAILELNPTTATVYGDERYDDRLEDPSPAGRAAAARAHGADAGGGRGDPDRRPAGRGPDHPRHARSSSPTPASRRTTRAPSARASSTRSAARRRSCRS